MSNHIVWEQDGEGGKWRCLVRLLTTSNPQTRQQQRVSQKLPEEDRGQRMNCPVNVVTCLWKEIRLLQQSSGVPDPLASKKSPPPDPCQGLIMVSSAAAHVGAVRTVHGQGYELSVMGTLHQSTLHTHLPPHSKAHCPRRTLSQTHSPILPEPSPRSSQC